MAPLKELKRWIVSKIFSFDTVWSWTWLRYDLTDIARIAFMFNGRQSPASIFSLKPRNVLTTLFSSTPAVSVITYLNFLGKPLFGVYLDRLLVLAPYSKLLTLHLFFLLLYVRKCTMSKCMLF